MGFLSGTVVGAVGYRLYEENKGQLCNLIQPVSPCGSEVPHAQPTLEELMAQKEYLEDIIAEKAGM